MVLRSLPTRPNEEDRWLPSAPARWPLIAVCTLLSRWPALRWTRCSRLAAARERFRRRRAAVRVSVVSREAMLWCTLLMWPFVRLTSWVVVLREVSADVVLVVRRAPSEVILVPACLRHDVRARLLMVVGVVSFVCTMVMVVMIIVMVVVMTEISLTGSTRTLF